MRLHKSGFAIAAALFLLPGCSQNRPPEAADTAAQAQVPEIPDAWSAGTKGEAIEVGWLASFEDQTLRDLVSEAQVHNKSLQAAAANVDRARALARQAGSALKPQVGLSAGGSRSGVAGSSAQTDNLNLGLDISWELDVWGRLRAGRRGALASAESAEADFRFSQYSLAAGVARGYFLAIEAGQQEEVAQETVAALEETLRIVDLRYENGVVSAQDQALARADLATARDRLVTVEGSRRDALRSLEVLLGRYPAAELEVGKTLPLAPPHPPAGLPSEILERRPDLIAAERQVAAAFDAVDQARAARLPTLGLTGSLGGSSSDLSSLVDPANLAWRVGSSLLAPLFDGGRRRDQVTVATADQEQALAAYGQAALQAFGEVETSLDQGVILSRRREELTIAAKEAKEAHRIADLRYREGESDLLDVLGARQRVIAADSNLVSVERQLLDQRVNLHLALGGNWQVE
ncbi:MAG: efflux transporter outer membrane subunit [Deltaproteobacteria bacterium]|nr:efflux transporter outer membrane subunit [Deltaproteobacteria bacterium]